VSKANKLKLLKIKTNFLISLKSINNRNIFFKKKTIKV